jgi:hypothetical protein
MVKETLNSPFIIQIISRQRHVSRCREMICLSGIMMIYNRKSLYDEHKKAL